MQYQFLNFRLQVLFMNQTIEKCHKCIMTSAYFIIVIEIPRIPVEKAKEKMIISWQSTFFFFFCKVTSRFPQHFVKQSSFLCRYRTNNEKRIISISARYQNPGGKRNHERCFASVEVEFGIQTPRSNTKKTANRQKT